MPPEPIPKDPVYLTYLHRSEDIRPAHPERLTTPYRPATGLTHTELQLQAAKGIYQHFHRPFNDHSRFLTVASPTDQAAYRDMPRLAPPPWDGSPPGTDLATSRGRPLSAPGSARRSVTLSPQQRVDIGSATLLDNMTTQTGAPCYTVDSIIDADLQTGQPLLSPDSVDAKEAWRVARVETYQVPPSRMGYGEGGARPFHQDYRHYKYFGFAGHGAKTSWAHNPKMSRINREVYVDSKLDFAAGDSAPPPPLQETIGGPRRQLTPAEKALVSEFQTHNYSSEGVPSDPEIAHALGELAAGRMPSEEGLRRLGMGVNFDGTARRGAHVGQTIRAGAGGGAHTRERQAEILEPFNTKVDLRQRVPLPPDTNLYGNDRAARVTTYRQMASPYAGEINRSPNHGSQSPWHQRYSHYKYQGFAGQGASSSWARNPKYAKLYD